MTAPAAQLAEAPLAPQNLDAEETVLGGILLAAGQDTALAATTIEKARQAGLQAAHFYRASHGLLYAVLVELADEGRACDAINVSHELRSRSIIDPDQARVLELASIAPAVGLVPAHAKIVADMAERRRLIGAAARLENAARNGGLPANPELRTELAEILDGPSAGTATLQPLWLDQALKEPLPAISEYVEGVLETGVLSDIVGLPYLGKSVVALELAIKIAKGRGLFLGRYPILKQTNVGYFWADDSRPKELKRIQDYADANNLDERGQQIPIAFYLNPGINLPDDLPAIKQQIRQHELGFLIFDSLYNFADFDFVKDTGAVKHLYATLKRLCDDVDGLTIVLVDHGAKPNDANKGRDDSIASYGSIWKAAAVRSSLVLSGTRTKTWISATGNNVKGFPRTEVFFNQERLELTVAPDREPDDEREERLEELVLHEITRKPGQSTNQIQKTVKGRNQDIRAAIARLEAANMIVNTYGTSSQLLGTTPDELSHNTPENLAPDETGPPGTKRTKTAWIPLNQAEKPRPDKNGTTPDEPPPTRESEPRPESSSREPLYVVEGSGPHLSDADPGPDPNLEPDPNPTQDNWWNT